MEYIISVILGIIGNLLTPTAKKLLRWPVEPNDPQPLSAPEAVDVPSEDHKELIRAYNRARLERASRIILVHGLTFLFLFAAYFLPLTLKSMWNKDIDFSTTRFAVLGIHLIIDHEQTAWLSLAATLLLYVPVWLLSQSLGHVVASMLDHIHKVTPARYMSLITLSFFALSFVIAGHWIYLLFPSNSYLMSLALPVLAVFGVGYMSSNQR
jgi:Na+-driven multidrug efflux pump